jgi:cell division protein FtsQ
LQSLETGPEIWRRASPSPAPRPVLKSSQATLAPPIVRRRRGGALLPANTSARATILVGLALLALAATGATQGAASPLLTELERWLELAGFGLRQVAITGYRFTADGDIFDAIDLEHARTLLSFDSRAAQGRIEALPWVDTASIERILPDRIEVRIKERTPIAVWQRGEGLFLIDGTGRVLAAVPGNRVPPLPRISGEGAAEAAADLLGLLAAHPTLLKELALAERVGERRWTLWLADGGSIVLPATGETAALARAVAIRGALAWRAIAIDLRVANRPLIAGAPPRDAVAANGPSGRT